jgi:hypothetical protein
MKTDIDALHQIFLNKNITDKQSGKTFATCYDLMGCVELNHKTIFYIINFYNARYYVMQMFIDIAKEKNYELIQPSNDTIKIMNSTIRFITKESAELILKGIDNYSIVEMEV